MCRPRARCSGGGRSGEIDGRSGVCAPRLAGALRLSNDHPALLFRIGGVTMTCIGSSVGETSSLNSTRTSAESTWNSVGARWFLALHLGRLLWGRFDPSATPSANDRYLRKLVIVD